MNTTKNFLQKIRAFVVSHKVVSTIILIVVVFAGYKLIKGNTAVQNRYVLGTVEKSSLIVSTSGSGQVSASNQIDVKPKISGIITSIDVISGQEVGQGKALFSIDAGDAEKTVRDAKLNVQTAELDLENAKQNYDNTKTSQELALSNLLNTLNSTVVALPDDANQSTNILTLSGSYNSTDTGRYTLEAYSCQGGMCVKYTGIESDTFTVDLNIPKPLGARGLYVTFTSMPANGDKWYVDVPSPTASSYASNLKSYTEKQESVKEAIQTAEQTVKAKEIALTQKQNALLDAETALSDFYITAPFKGTIASIPVKKGDNASPSTVLATLITNQEIAEVSMNEVDVAKIKLGQKATLTFDAVSGLTITGEISEIDSVGTVSQGVVTYNVKITFDTNDERVKPGMSVSAEIITDVKQDVLIVPNGALKTEGGQSYVEVLDSPDPEVAGTQGVTSKIAPRQVSVETGISNDTSTEIVSGLTEGDKIITRTITATATTAAATSAPSLFGGGGGNRTAGGGGAVRLPAGR